MPSVITPVATQSDVSSPLSGEPASASELRTEMVQPLTNRIYRLEQLLDGVVSRAVALLGAFWAKSNSTFGTAEHVGETTHTVYSVARFNGGSEREGPEISSTVECPDADATVNAYKRHIVFNTVTASRILHIGFTTPVWSSFTVWNDGNFPVAAVIGETSIGTVPSGSHRTFRANASGVLHMYA